ncbi:Gfo/Idh/MocA family oxidoreductase [Patescibacteria group bacterium]|nr:Gfo/Idh/MocA family oxidoreductase [Patescibacteria group bacterium]
MLKIALIGLGHIAKYQIDAINKVSGIELVDAHDIDSAKATTLPPTVNFHKTIESLLDKSLADVFVVSTPNVTHYKIGQRLLEKQRAVLLEKPVCTAQEELDLLLDLVSGTKQFVSVAFHAAFASDVAWWLENSHESKYGLGELIGFNAGFFDPYIINGQIAPTAESLGGSWIDSGINALSVITKFIEPTLLSVNESRMTTLPVYNCSQVQGLSLMSFPTTEGYGHGIVDTNWSLGINRKSTRLWYEHGDVLLYHSLESVFTIDNGKPNLLADLRNQNSRLTNHYCSLFQDLIYRFRSGESNIEYAAKIHRLLFEAMEENVYFTEVECGTKQT